MAISLNRNKTTEEETLEHPKSKKWPTKQKIWVNKIDFSSPLEFSELCLKVEAKIIPFFAVVLNVNKENI